jgi:urease accessory protein
MMSDQGLPLPLLVWFSPGFPAGAFAYSHGLEWAVESRQVRNAFTLREWLKDLCGHGSLRADAVLLMSAYRAAIATDWNEVRAVNDLALALAPSRERLLETGTQGSAFLTAVLASWRAPGLAHFAEMLGESDLAYPVAAGVSAGAHQIAARPLCDAFTLAAVVNLVSAAIRLGPVGQTDAQGVIADLCPALERLAIFAEQSSVGDCGSAAWGADIASMRHETQYSRLFRS